MCLEDPVSLVQLVSLHVYSSQYRDAERSTFPILIQHLSLISRGVILIQAQKRGCEVSLFKRLTSLGITKAFRIYQQGRCLVMLRRREILKQGWQYTGLRIQVFGCNGNFICRGNRSHQEAELPQVENKLRKVIHSHPQQPLVHPDSGDKRKLFQICVDTIIFDERFGLVLGILF